MKLFWPILGGTVLLVFLGFAQLPQATSYEWTPPLWSELTFFALAGVLVAVPWAIFYRKQIEGRRLATSSFFVLMAMEAAWFAAFKHFNPQ